MSSTLFDKRDPKRLEIDASDCAKALRNDFVAGFESPRVTDEDTVPIYIAADVQKSTTLPWAAAL